jgi:hypothetical protein
MWMGTLFVSNIFKTPMWANPLADPDPRTNAILAGLGEGGGEGGARVSGGITSLWTQEALSKVKTRKRSSTGRFRDFMGLPFEFDDPAKGQENEGFAKSPEFQARLI